MLLAGVLSALPVLVGGPAQQAHGQAQAPTQAALRGRTTGSAQAAAQAPAADTAKAALPEPTADPAKAALRELSADSAQAPVPVSASAGELIYRQGRLPDGSPLRAARAGGIEVTGTAAACVQCHRRSGLGSYEGSVLVPPIIGPYLFRERAANLTDLALPHVPGFMPNLEAYSEATLAVAIRTGVARGGRALNALMPRYALGDAAMAQLIAYLRPLSTRPVGGVGEQSLDFATIVTADADPAERAAMLEVLQAYVKERNATVATRVQGAGSAGAAEYRSARSWRLHVWELKGSADSWEGQLQSLLAKEPVFAVISGVGRSTWAPVHRFCEDNQVPCLFPNVDLAPVAEQDFYPVYYSRGVLLEADLIAARLAASAAVQEPAGQRAVRIVQIYRAGDIGTAAADALARWARSQRVDVENWVLADEDHLPVVRADVARVLAAAGTHDSLVLWLRPADIAALGAKVPTAEVYVSGVMANLEDAPLPAAWRESVLMTYPYDTPDLRRVRENFPHAWLRKQGIRITTDRLQSNTYLTCTIVADALDEMLDAFLPDLLIERLENMLGARLTTGYYPRLSLATGQRFASKGGYIVKFDPRNGARVAPTGPWAAP